MAGGDQEERRESFERWGARAVRDCKIRHSTSLINPQRSTQQVSDAREEIIAARSFPFLPAGGPAPFAFLVTSTMQKATTQRAQPHTAPSLSISVESPRPFLAHSHNGAFPAMHAPHRTPAAPLRSCVFFIPFFFLQTVVFRFSSLSHIAGCSRVRRHPRARPPPGGAHLAATAIASLSRKDARSPAVTPQ